jgi:uncharacterized protein
MTEAETIMRHFYGALARGDSGAAFALFSPTIEWTSAERSPYYAGTVTGTEAIVAKVFAPINQDFDGFASTPSDFVSQDDRIVSFGVYTGRAKIGGRALNAPFAHVWTVRDGRIVRFIQYTESGAWAEALKTA